MVEWITVKADFSYDGDQRFFAVSLSTSAWLAVIHIAPEEVERLNDVIATPWDGAGLRIGRSAGGFVFWSVNGNDKATIVISIGEDDEPCDVSFAVPATTIRQILDAIKLINSLGSP
jgi:hypothetical protein